MKPSLKKSLIFALTLLALTFSALGGTPALAAEKKALPSVKNFLNNDGTLNLTSGYTGALDVAGYDVTIDSKRGPLFQPAPSILNAWSALGTAASLSITVKAIAISGTNVYAGGSFTDAGGDPNADYIAKWDGTSWSALGTTPLDGWVNAITASGTDVYVGGNFADAGGVPNASYIAKWNGSAWSALGATPLNFFVFAITISGMDVYAGGFFTDAGGDPNADYIAKWDGNAWSALGTTSSSLGFVFAIAIDGTDVYAGGPSSIAKFNGISWSALGAAPLNNTVQAIAISGTDVYVGGLFTNAGGDGDADYIAKWNGTSWSALGATPLSGSVYSIAINGTDIYASGSFFDVGGDVNLNTIAKWNGNAWSGLGTGLNSTVYTITISGTDIYAGGNFFNAGGDPNADSIAVFGLPVPEMGLKQNTTAIADGGSYDFGSKDTGTNTDIVFTIENTGSANLTLTTPVTIDGTNANQFSIQVQPTSPVSVSGNTTYTVRFTPTSTGAKTATLSIANNDSNENPYDLTLTGTGTDVSAPTVNIFTVTTTSSNLNIPITAFAASDNSAVTGYMITTSATPPAAGTAGWSGTAPTSYTVGAFGSYTLYPWAKDGAGNVSAAFGSPRTVTVTDSAAPTVNTFTATTPSSSLNIPITAFTASDNVAVTGYLITTTATPPAAGAAGWKSTPATIFTVTGNGSYTLYPWAKDGAGNVSAVFGSPRTVTVTITPSFTDVPANHWALSFIERLRNSGITSGCGAGNYCPDNTVTRAEMAVFLLKGMHGSSFTPPAINGVTNFTDVATSHWAASWIKQFAAEGITSGCGAGIYCPDSIVTRAQMAVFLLKAKHGASYTPPAISGSTGFGDVATTYWAAAWIKQLAAEGVSSGCGNGNYCPDNSMTRAEMAVFLVKAFGLP